MNRLFISTDSTRHPADPRMLVEVVIKGKGVADAEPLHDYKARTVHETEQMIPIGTEHFQSPLKIFLIHLLKKGRFATEQAGRHTNR